MKRPTTVKIDEELKRKAKEMGFNFSRLLEDKIREELDKINNGKESDSDRRKSTKNIGCGLSDPGSIPGRGTAIILKLLSVVSQILRFVDRPDCRSGFNSRPGH